METRNPHAQKAQRSRALRLASTILADYRIARRLFGYKCATARLSAYMRNGVQLAPNYNYWKLR